MFSTNLRIAWRNLVKDRQFTFLNLIGLSTGLACAFLIWLWVSDELSVDKFNEKDSRLYQVMKTFPGADGSISTFDVTQGLIPQALVKEMPEVEWAIPVMQQDMGILSAGDQQIRAKPQFVDKDFFHVFSYRLTGGNKNNPLAGKYEVLLSDKLAMKLFNTTKNIIGKTVAWKGGGKFDGPFTVSGVFEAPPSNASVQFDFLLNYDLYAEKELSRVSNWDANSTNTYVVLKKGVNPGQFNAKLKDFSKVKYKAARGPEGLKWEGDLFLQRYSDRYLYNRYENGIQAGGRIEYVRLFSIIALFILAIACINFMNLSTAKAAGRMKEVGIKKVVGAGRRTLIFQYLGESLLMTFVSLALALLFVGLTLPEFNSITGKRLTLHFDTGLIAGSYPAFYLSGFKPVTVLKGKLQASLGELWIRKGLVVFQFTLSAVFIIAVMVVYRQMEFIRTKDLGYNKDNILSFKKEGRLKEGQETFLSELKKMPGVVNASGMGYDMTGPSGTTGGLDWEGKKPGEGIEFSSLAIGYDLLETLGFQMAAGRGFSRKFGSDSSTIIFNQAAIAAMGLKDPIGKTISLWGKQRLIVGVVRNFHFESLHEKLKPCFFLLASNSDNDNIVIKIKGGTEKGAIARLEKFYKEFNPGLAFEYQFLDEGYQALYVSEQRVAILSRYFAGMAILISCLGLFGLAAFTAQKRQKEIGIRKVIGASVGDVVMMLSGDFLKLVLIAVLVAFPLSWWAMNQWLNGFAYRVHLGIGVFAIAGASIVLITLLTISFQSVKAGLANPVRSLRSE